MTFTKGQSGNPKGRPRKGKSMTERLRLLLERKGPDGIKNRDAILETLIKQARDGSLAATNLILERVEGKVPDNHNINFTQSAEWTEMKTLIINVLAPYPDLLRALGEAVSDRERKLLGDKSVQ